MDAADVAGTRVAAVDLAGSLAIDRALPHGLAVDARRRSHQDAARARVATAVVACFAARRVALAERGAVDAAVIAARGVTVVEVIAVDAAVIATGGVAVVERVAVDRARRALAFDLTGFEAAAVALAVVIAEGVAMVVVAARSVCRDDEKEEHERRGGLHIEGVDPTRARAMKEKTRSGVDVERVRRLTCWARVRSGR